MSDVCQLLYTEIYGRLHIHTKILVMWLDQTKKFVMLSVKETVIWPKQENKFIMWLSQTKWQRKWYMTQTPRETYVTQSDKESIMQHWVMFQQNASLSWKDTQTKFFFAYTQDAYFLMYVIYG